MSEKRPQASFSNRLGPRLDQLITEHLIRTMSGQITTRIREKILTGAYPPGSPLLQDVIAAEFGVSKIPVREALVQLRAEGLVDVFAHRGFQVRPLSAMEVDEVFRLRLQIEPGAAAEGARRALSSDAEAARLAFTNLNDALLSGELYESGDLNRTFHLALIVPRLQPVTAEVLGRLHTLSQRYVRMHLLPRGRVKRATKEHTSLFEAWTQGKTAEVTRLTHAHIETTREDLARLLQAPK
jgi:DNA-binding GntR family transcriptional regulator